MDLRSMEFVHDLKTPVQLIYSCVQLIEAELGPDARAEKYLRILEQSADQLLGMVSRALQPQAADLSACDVMLRARSLSESFAALCAHKGVEFSFRTNADSLWMRADRERFDRVLQNLFSNALRFTPPGGRIEFEARAMNDAVEFEIADSGCGIPPEMQARVFETGVSADSTGLGLPEARAFARSMGGEITFESAPGSGSRFTLRLPVAGY